MQWQHGSFEKEANGSLILQPIAVDGRELISEPCTSDTAVVLRFNDPAIFLVRWTFSIVSMIWFYGYFFLNWIPP